MATIQDLRNEIRKEKSWQENDIELEKLGHERRELEKELKSLRFERKFKNIKPIVSGAKSAFNTIAKGVTNLQRNVIEHDKKNRFVKQKKRGLGLF